MAELSSLGKYEIRRELGRGAMGVVYEGYDPMIKRMVALKTIRADQLAGENAETVVARFRREAQAAGRLNHPNIVAIYDFGEDQGVWYIAMEFIKGRELKDYFQANERFATADIVRIMTQILAALGYSHKLGVIHRDIKPANVFLLDDGSVKVADFGIAHIESSNMTQVGTRARHAELHVARADPGAADRRAVGPLLRRRHPLPVPDRRAALQRIVDDDDAQGARGGTAAAVAIQRAGAGRDGRRRAQGARQAPRRALPDRRGIRRRAPRRGAARVDAPRRSHADRAERSDRDPRAGAEGADGACSGVAPGGTPDVHAPAAAAAANAARRAHRIAPPKKSQATAIAIVAGIAVVAVAAVLWTCSSPPRPHPSSGDAATLAQAPMPQPAAKASGADAAGATAEDRSRHDGDLRRRIRRSERSALRNGQGAAVRRSARGLEEPARREGARADARHGLARARTTTCCRTG